MYYLNINFMETDSICKYIMYYLINSLFKNTKGFEKNLTLISDTKRL